MSLSSLDLERQTLGSLLQFPEVFLDIDTFITEKDYTFQPHRHIFSIIKLALTNKEVINPIIIIDRLNSIGINFGNDIEISDYIDALGLITTNKEIALQSFKELKKFTVAREINNIGLELQALSKKSPTLQITDIITKSDDIYNKTINLYNSYQDPIEICSDIERLVEDRGNNPITENGFLGPFPTINRVFGSLLRPSAITLIGARTGQGKAQPIDEPILTPNGWAKIGELKVGDFVVGDDGKPTKVIGVYPQGKKKTYELILDDGGKTRACEDHLWYVKSYQEIKYNRDWKIVNTKEIIENLYIDNPDGTRRSNYAIPFCKPIKHISKKLEIHPYVLGVLIGGGSLSGSSVALTSTDPFVLDSFSKKLRNGDSLSRISNTITYSVVNRTNNRKGTHTKKALTELGLFGCRSYEKLIPKEYLYSSIKNRIYLLRGLMDTDGYADKRGVVSYSTSSKQLAEDVINLVRSLGGRASVFTKRPFFTYKGQRKEGRLSYQITIRFEELNPFSLKKKSKRYFTNKRRGLNRYFKDFKYLGELDSVCIKVENKKELYITNDYIVTHNTTMSMAYLSYVSEKYKTPILHLDCGEMTAEELQFRTAAMLSHGKVPFHVLETGKFRKVPQYVEIMRKEVFPRLKNIQIYYEGIGGLQPREIINLIKRFYYKKIGRGNRLIVSYDYLKPFDLYDKNNPEWKIMGHFIQDLKNFITNEIPEISVWTSLQLNRSGITGNKQVGEIDDTENTFSISDRIVQQTTHAFILRYKTPEEIQRDGERFGNARLSCVKKRHLGEDAMDEINPVLLPDKKSMKNYYNLQIDNFHFEDRGDLRSIVDHQLGNIDISTGFENEDSSLI